MDYAVGIVLHKQVGDRVSRGEPVAELYVNETDRLEEVQQMVRSAITISADAPEPSPLIYEIIE